VLNSLFQTLSIAALILSMRVAAIAGQDEFDYCYQSKVEMPTLNQHRAWLEQNPRYGVEFAAPYYARAKMYGDKFVQYQIYYQKERSYSRFAEIFSWAGIREAKGNVITDTQCKFPIVFMVGLKPKSIKDRVLYVSDGRGLFSILDLGHMKPSRRPFQIKLIGSNKTICRDIRRGSLWVNEQLCMDVSTNFK